MGPEQIASVGKEGTWVTVIKKVKSFLCEKEPRNALKSQCFVFCETLRHPPPPPAPLWFSEAQISKDVSRPLCVLTTDTQSERGPFGFQAEFSQGLNGAAASEHRWQRRRNSNKDAAAVCKAKETRRESWSAGMTEEEDVFTPFSKSKYWPVKEINKSLDNLTRPWENASLRPPPKK